MSASRFIECTVWVVLLGMLAFLLGNSDLGLQRVTVVVAGAIAVVHGAVTFIRHGGSRITVLGLFNAASAMFVGFAGIYAVVARDPRVPLAYLGIAVLAGLIFQLLVTSLAWGNEPVSVAVRFPAIRNANWAAWWGVGILLALIAVDRVGVASGLGGGMEGAAVSATVVLAIGLLWRPKARLFSFSTLVIFSAFVLYAEVFHSGAGRLRIVALGCALILLFSLRFQRRILKWVTLAAIPIAVLLLAAQRLSLQESLAAGASAGRNGLESMLVPIVIFGQLIHAQVEGFGLAWGSSLLTAPLSVLPEAWSPDAPRALGYELVQVFAPERYGSEYSVAATIAGEAVFNFALPGIIIFVPLLAWALKFMDRRIVAAAVGLADGRAPLVALAFWVVFGGAVADLAWAGQHVFLTRTALRLPVILGLLVLARLDTRFMRERENLPTPQRAGPGT